MELKVQTHIISMLKVISGIQGTDIFTKNSHGYLIHQWSRAPHLESFEYRVVAKSVSGKPFIMCSSQHIHICFKSLEKELKHLKLDKKNPHDATETIVCKKVSSSTNPACVAYGKNIYCYFVDEQGKLVEKSISLAIKNEIKTRFIQEKKGVKSMFNTFVTQNGQAFFFYKKVSSLYWISLKNTQKKVTEQFVKLPFSANVERPYEIMEKKGIFYIFLENDKHQIMQIAIDVTNKTLLYSKKLSEIKSLCQSQMTVISDEEKVSVWFASSKNELICCSKLWKAQEWSQDKYSLKENLGAQLLIKFIQEKMTVFFLDKNQIWQKHEVVFKGDSKIGLIKEKNLPYLIWDQVKQKTKVVGQGYWTEVFSHSDLGMAIKKFRTADHASMVNKEIKNQFKLQKIEPNMIGHRLYQNGVLMGFSLPLLKGMKWEDMRKNNLSLVSKSPVARVKLLISLADHIRAIQSIGLCHGDIHMGNIIKYVDEDSSVLQPKAWAKVIDFGNAFDMLPGKTVSATGLTGAMNLIPKQVHDAKWKNYNPFGINPHQLANIGLSFLLKEQWNGGFKNQQKLKQLNSRMEYPLQIKAWFKELTHEDIKRRVKALEQNISHFQKITRELFTKNQEKSKDEDSIHEKKVLQPITRTQNTPKTMSKSVIKAQSVIKKVEVKKMEKDKGVIQKRTNNKIENIVLKQKVVAKKVKDKV